MSTFKERVTPHLRRLIEDGSEATARQFLALAKEESATTFGDEDPLEEEKYVPVKGIVHKYRNRVLWKVSYKCAAHCQFCTRRRQVGMIKGDLTAIDVETGIDYLLEHPEVEEVILSGGDPLFNPKITATILQRLSAIDSIKAIRIGTRLPIHLPQAFQSSAVKNLLALMSKTAMEKAVYVLIHVNHPDELTPATKKVIAYLRRSGMILLSQTVFLKGVNDETTPLAELFKSIYHLGVIPYYIFRCDYVAGLESFICEISKEQLIMTELCRNLSGIAIPTYVVDVPGKGKIPVPLGFWEGVNLSRCRDFEGEEIIL